MGCTLPAPCRFPTATRAGCVVVDRLARVSGRNLPASPTAAAKGQLGHDVTIEQGYGQRTGRRPLDPLEVEKGWGSLDRIEPVMRLFGFVTCAPGFGRVSLIRPWGRIGRPGTERIAASVGGAMARGGGGAAPTALFQVGRQPELGPRPVADRVPSFIRMRTQEIGEEVDARHPSLCRMAPRRRDPARERSPGRGVSP